MQLKGKKVLFLGDSITAGVGVSALEKRYTDVFASMTGCKALNYGIAAPDMRRKKFLPRDGITTEILFHG